MDKVPAGNNMHLSTGSNSCVTLRAEALKPLAKNAPRTFLRLESGQQPCKSLILAKVLQVWVCLQLIEILIPSFKADGDCYKPITHIPQLRVTAGYVIHACLFFAIADEVGLIPAQHETVNQSCSAIYF